MAEVCIAAAAKHLLARHPMAYVAIHLDVRFSDWRPEARPPRNRSGISTSELNKRADRSRRRRRFLGRPYLRIRQFPEARCPCAAPLVDCSGVRISFHSASVLRIFSLIFLAGYSAKPAPRISFAEHLNIWR